jgi:hypothetical protein
MTAMIQTLQASPPKPGEISQLWQSERVSLETAIRQIRHCVGSASSETDSSFRQLSDSVGDLALQLRCHFNRGSELYDAARERLWCVEVDLAKGNAQADHVYLLGRLERIAAGFQESDATFVSFGDAIEQLEWFFDELDQHEEHQAESFDWLLQTDCD